ncbi:hypothetical protein II898_06245 [bacterium]|nr:hypothetical protein [bacterium]
MTKILILNPEDWRRFVEAQNSKLRKSFKPFEIEAKTVGDMVSRKQQSYIYAAIYPRLKEALIDAGYSIQNLTENQFDYFMREMFYSDIVVTSKGEKKIPRRLCFDKAHRDEVSKYIDDLLHFASQIGCYIPSQFVY